jgi:RimJ/RimL family protein N-acetyltransferase
VFHRSERLFLRPSFPEDSAAIHACLGADEGLVRNLARAPWPYRLDDARAFAALPQNPHLPHFLVTLPGAGVIGSVGIAAHARAPELGYWIARAHWGHGYATEAAGAVLRIARTLGHRELFAGHFVDNPASGRVLQKIGFVPTGRVSRRFSLARGADVESVDHVLDLDAVMNPVPFPRAA